MTEENVIEVLDKNTLKEIRKISTTDQLGTTQGSKPRQLFAMDGYVYYTTYGGENGSVAEIDTTDFKMNRSWTVGSYPEGITGSSADGGTLFVANSNYAQGNGTLTWINLSKVGNYGVTTKAVKGIENPTQVFISQGQYYAVVWPLSDNVSLGANWQRPEEGRYEQLGVHVGNCGSCNDGCQSRRHFLHCQRPLWRKRGLV